MSNQPQSYVNHRQRLASLYVLAGLAFLVATGIAMYGFVKAPSLNASVLPLLGVGGLLLWFSLRVNSLKLQDRVIRAEMRARWERVLGKDRGSEFERLTLKQLIALRFASDTELPVLAAEVLAGTTTAPDAIKRKVQDWQADQVRV